MKKLILLIALTTSCILYSQPNLPEKKADSLWGVWKDDKNPDTVRLKAIHYYTHYGYTYTNPDSAIFFSDLIFKFARQNGIKKYMAKAHGIKSTSYYLMGDFTKAIDYDTRGLTIYREIGYKKGVALSLHNIAMAHNNRGDYLKAFDFYDRSLKIKKSIDDKRGIAKTLNNIGNIHYVQGDYSEAINYYIRSLKIKDKVGDKKGVATAYNNIGSIYHNQGDLIRALDYFKRSLVVREEIGDKKGKSSSLNNIGNVYLNKGDFNKAIDYFNQSLAIFEELESKKNIATIMKNIGDVYSKKDDYPKAIDHYERSLHLREDIGDKKGVASSLISIAKVYNEQARFYKALEYSKIALERAEEIGAAQETLDAANLLRTVYKKLGRYQESLKMYDLYIETKNTIESEKNEKEIIRQELKYEYEKQATADSIKAAEKEKVSDAQITAQKAQLKQEETQRYALYGGLALLVIFAIFMYNRFRVTRKQKKIIEKQKAQVDIQRDLVEKKNKEIMDSIQYAKRIQSAILPTGKRVKEYLPKSFILYKPKDIVAGDFYWLENSNEKLLFAAADCTGHGVPGAMVSVVCNNGLNRSVREHGLNDPGKILDKTREIVITEFEKSEDEVKDGMDISICALNTKTKELQWSGANNPLWIIRKGEISEIKPNKQPIGVVDNSESFTTHHIELQKDDTIYIFTDGFQDQFGGNKGKKFKPKALRELLLSIQGKSMKIQRQLIDEAFESWKGDLEQVDDVCLIGVRV